VSGKASESFSSIWYGFPIAVILTIVYIFVFRKSRFTISAKTGKSVAVVALLLLFIFNGRYYLDWIEKRTYNIAETNFDTSQILDQGAVVTGTEQRVQYGIGIM